ncbi:MAG: M18 family aminopeptidase, partial [Acidimicrobiia bacterium]|nr:M18 family aminopeptidase [Acidimicrobiia bacterium]
MPPVDAQPITDLSSFIEASPTPYHAVARAVGLLVEAGYTQLDETAAWPAEPGGYLIVRDGSLVAWQIAAGHGPGAGFRIVGAHTDSPNLRLKPQPDTGRSGYRQLGVEVYGGVLLNSWLDRDLGVAGRMVLVDGTVTLVRHDDHAVRVPQLAIHLDREVGDQGLVLNRQQHMAPVWSLEDSVAFLDEFCAQVGVDADLVAGFDLMLHDLEPPRVLGYRDELLAAPRIDNLLSCHSAVQALCRTDTSAAAVPVVALFDHEEVGSTTASGAASPLLAGTLDRIVGQLGGDRDEAAR